MKKEELKLTDNPIKNMQLMAPYLNEKEQYIIFGMALASQLNMKEAGNKADKKAG